MSKNKAKKRQQQFTPTCIFCKGTPVTEEHLFPRWMERELSKEGDDKHVFNNFRSLDSIGSRMHVTSKVLNRNIARLVVKRVCGPCNNGWMSQIETDSKPILKSLILDEPIELSLSDQEILTKWAVLRSLVGEYVNDQVDKVTSKEDRLSFFEKREVSPRFKIWIGRSRADDPEFNQLYINFTAFMMPSGIVLTARPEPNVKWAVFIKKNLFIIVFWSEIECNAVMPPAIAHKLIELYPPVYESIDNQAIPACSQQEMSYIREDLTRDSFAILTKQ